MGEISFYRSIAPQWPTECPVEPGF